MTDIQDSRSLSTAALEFIRLFEENIGRAPPLLVVKLQEAVERYPAGWLVKAVEEACLYNKRSWRHMETMLRAWESGGQGERRELISSHPDFKRAFRPDRNPRRRRAEGMELPDEGVALVRLPGPSEREARDIFEKAKESLRPEVTRPIFQTWLAGTYGAAWIGEALTVLVPSRFTAEHLSGRMHGWFSLLLAYGVTMSR